MLKYRPYDVYLPHSIGQTKSFQNLREVYSQIVKDTTDIDYIFYDENDDDFDDLDDGYYTETSHYRISDFYLCPLYFDDSYMGWKNSRYILTNHYNGEKLSRPKVVGVISHIENDFLFKIKELIFGHINNLFQYPQEIYEENEKLRYSQILEYYGIE